MCVSVCVSVYARVFEKHEFESVQLARCQLPTRPSIQHFPDLRLRDAAFCPGCAGWLNGFAGLRSRQPREAEINPAAVNL